MPDLEAVHQRLRLLLEPYREDFSVTADGPRGLALEVPGLEGKPWGYVAGTRLGKRYVSFYLMPVYADPALSGSVSPALAKRRQGKSCFNFTTVDEALFAELGDLAAKGIPGFRAIAEAAASSPASPAITGPLDTPVSSRVVDRIAHDYPASERRGVEDVLTSLDLRPWKIGASSAGRERIHAAILILAGGDHERLRRAVELATKDWRDVLMAADLADGSWPERVSAYLAP